MGTNWKCLIAASMTLALGSACDGENDDGTDRHPITGQPNSGESNGSTTGESSGAGPEGGGVAGQGSNTASSTGSSGTDGSGTPGAGTTGQTSNDGATGQTGSNGSTGQSGDNGASGNATSGGTTAGMPDNLVLTGVDESKLLRDLTEAEVDNLCAFLDSSYRSARTNFGGSSSDEELFCTYWGGGPGTPPEQCRQGKEYCLANDLLTLDLSMASNCEWTTSLVNALGSNNACKLTVADYVACRRATDQAEWNVIRTAACEDPNTRPVLDEPLECAVLSQDCQL